MTTKAKVEQERELILNGNIRKLLVKFSVPATIGLLLKGVPKQA